MKMNNSAKKINNVLNITKFLSFHYYEFDKDFYHKGESHNSWELVYVDSGAFEVVADDTSFILKQGEIAFHRPNEFHALHSDKKTASNVFIMTFSCSSKAMNFFTKKKIQVPSKL